MGIIYFERSKSSQDELAGAARRKISKDGIKMQLSDSLRTQSSKAFIVFGTVRQTQGWNVPAI